MRKIFAIFILLLFISIHIRKDLNKNINLETFYSKHSIFNLTGDFNGDNQFEHMYIYEDEVGNCFLILIDNDEKHIRKLNFSISNTSTHIEDVNKDKRDDLIIYTIDKGVEKIYVFSFNEEIYELLSPELLETKISFKADDEKYILKFGDLEKIVPSGDILNLSIYFTDYDYRNKSLVFMSQGSITNLKNDVLYDVFSEYQINEFGLIEVKEVRIQNHKHQ